MARTFTAFHVRTWSLHDHVVVRVEDVRAGTSIELTGAAAVEVVRLLRTTVGSAEDAVAIDEATGTGGVEVVRADDGPVRRDGTGGSRERWAGSR